MLGVWGAVAAALLWGLSPVLIEEAMRESDSVYVSGMRNVGGLALLLPASALAGSLQTAPWELAVIAASALVSQVLGLVSYSEAIHRAGPGRAVPICFTYIFWAQAVGAVLFGEEVTALSVAGALLAVLGVWLVSSGSPPGRGRLGVQAALLTSVLWAAGDALARAALEGADALAVSTWRGAFSASVLIPAAWARGGLSRGRRALLFSLASGVLGLGLALLLYYSSVAEVGLAAAAPATALSPVVSQAASRLATGERVGPRAAAGGLAVALGIALASARV